MGQKIAKPAAQRTRPAARGTGVALRPKPHSTLVGASGADWLALQRSAGNTAVSELLGETGGSQPLAPSTLSSMEEHFKLDFSGVRLHTDAAANEKAAALGARAFTSGNDIWFGRGHGPADHRLLQHELAHVVQQAQGRAAGLRGTGGDSSQRALLEMEASQASSKPVTSSSFTRGQASAAQPASQMQSQIPIQLDGPAPGAQTITVRTTSGRQYTISKNSPEFREKYIDFNMDHITFWLAPAFDPDPKKKRFTVYYKNKKRAVFDLDEIQVRKHRVWSPDTPKQATIKGMQVTPARTVTFEGMPPSYTEEGGLIFPDRYNDASTPNLVAVAKSIRIAQKLESDLLELRETAATFASLIALNASANAGISSMAASPRAAFPWRKGLKGKAGEGEGSLGAPPVVEESQKSSRNAPAKPGGSRSVDPQVDVEVERAFKQLPEEDPHSGAARDPRSQVRSKVGTKIPASKQAGERTDVLDVGAGPKETDLGTTPERQLVAVLRADVSRAGKPDVVLDATKPLSKSLHGRFNTMVINNPYGYVPNIAELRKGLAPGGKIIVQGNYGANKYFRSLTKVSVPGMRTTIERNVPVLGEGFSRTSGSGPVHPDSRISFELVNPRD